MAVTIKGFASDWSVPEPAKTKLGGLYAALDNQGRQPVRKDELVVNVRDYGAVADGATDDGPAIRAARSAAVGKVLFFPAGTYYYRATSALDISANTTFRGVAGATRILFEPATPGASMGFANNAGPNATLEGIEVVRNANFPAVLITVNGHRNFSIINCVLDGRRDLHSQYCHGLQLGLNNGLTTDGLNLVGCRLTRLTYGLFQSNTSLGVTRRIKVTGCEFSHNHATDLEFNSPNADIVDVVVSGCFFHDNQRTTTNAGFAVGLAHVTQCVIQGNTFVDYHNEAVHVEDFSVDTVIEGNIFKRCAKLYAAFVRIISGAKNITIANNQFDARDLTEKRTIIESTAGAGATTPGGRTATHPTQITVSGNMVHAGLSNGFYFSFAEDLSVTGNTLIGGGSVAALAYNTAGNGAYAVEFWGGTNVTAVGNNIRGFLYAMPRRTGNTPTGGEGFVFSNNSISHCKYGVSVVNGTYASVSGNIITHTIHPMLTGQGAGTSRPLTVTGNHAALCKYPLEIAGKLVIVAAGSAAVGDAQTLAIEPLGLNIPTGQTLAFAGGGTMVTTGSWNPGQTAITGNVTGSGISAGQGAIITGLPHSWGGSSNRIAVSGNIDTVAGSTNEQVVYTPDGTRKKLVVGNDGAVTTATI